MSDILQQGYLALPQGDAKSPRILVLHAWWGLNDFFKQFCDRLAAEGYVVFAPDMYAGKIATSIAQAETYSGELQPEKVKPMLKDALGALRQHPQAAPNSLAVIGFSLGAYYALELLRELPQDIRALVLFYGTGDVIYQPSKAAVLGHFAEVDEYESKSYWMQVEEALRGAGITTSFYEYPDTGHWFFEANQPAYNAEAAKLAWKRTIEFLKQQL